MRPEQYDAWYHTPRGAWIGAVEYRLLAGVLAPRRGETLLDVGCGTGHFTSHFAASGTPATGVDPNLDWLRFAQSAVEAARFVGADARALPFPDRSFDLAISVTALCFVAEQRRAVQEMVRVTRRRFAFGLLNRHSLLYLRKGRAGGSGAYRGAHWHTAAEARSLFEGLAVSNLTVRSAVFLDGASGIARAAEHLLPGVLPLGSFLVVAGECGAKPPDQATSLTVTPALP